MIRYKEASAQNESWVWELVQGTGRLISLCWEKVLDHKVTTQPRPGRTTLISGGSTQPTDHSISTGEQL